GLCEHIASGHFMARFRASKRPWRWPPGDKSRFRAGRWFYPCIFLPFHPRGARGSLQEQLGFPSWDRPLADSYEPTFDASTTTLADPHTIVEIDHVVIDHSNTAG